MGASSSATRTGEKDPVPRPALGRFAHEYTLVHEQQQKLYLTEDEKGGGFYRFTPDSWGDLSAGLLEIATLGSPTARSRGARFPTRTPATGTRANRWRARAT